MGRRDSRHARAAALKLETRARKKVRPLAHGRVILGMERIAMTGTQEMDGAVDALYGPLERFIRARVRNPDDAADVLHDVLERLLSREGPEDPAKLDAWAYGAARNAVVDHFRRGQRASRKHERIAVAAAHDAALARDTPETGTESTVDLRPALAMLLPELEADDRAILEEIDGKGVSQREYAEAHGLAYSTVKSRVQRARRRLHRKFARCCRITLDRRGNAIGCERWGGEAAGGGCGP